MHDATIRFTATLIFLFNFLFLIWPLQVRFPCCILKLCLESQITFWFFELPGSFYISHIFFYSFLSFMKFMFVLRLITLHILFMSACFISLIFFFWQKRSTSIPVQTYHRLWGLEGFEDRRFEDNRHMKLVRLSARTYRPPLPPQ